MLSRDNELAIDLLRGLLALFVLLSHVLGRTIEPLLGHDHNAWPVVLQLLWYALEGGRFWVRLFFVISGFCIHLSISRSLERGTFDLRSYAAARLTRIYPVYLVGLAMAVTFWFWDKEAANGGAFPRWELAGSLVMMQQISGVFPAFGPSWSLTSEAFYYAVWPLALIWCGGRQSKALQRSAVAALGITLAVVAVWKIVFHGDQSHWLIPWWCISGLYLLWLSGAWLAVRWKDVQAKITLPRWLLGVLWVAVIFAVEAALIRYQARAWAFLLADYLAIPGFVLLVAGGHHLKLSASSRWTSMAEWMGTFSYPCYLLHMVVFESVLTLVKWAMPIHPSAQHGLALAVTLALLGTGGLALERRFMAWRAAFLKGLRQPSKEPVMAVSSSLPS